MPKKIEANTDVWVHLQLNECGIPFDAQGSGVKEIDEVLKLHPSVVQVNLVARNVLL